MYGSLLSWISCDNHSEPWSRHHARSFDIHERTTHERCKEVGSYDPRESSSRVPIQSRRLWKRYVSGGKREMWKQAYLATLNFKTCSKLCENLCLQRMQVSVRDQVSRTRDGLKKRYNLETQARHCIFWLKSVVLKQPFICRLANKTNVYGRYFWIAF